jgi:hypothetical protein
MFQNDLTAKYKNRLLFMFTSLLVSFHLLWFVCVPRKKMKVGKKMRRRKQRKEEKRALR